MVVAEVVLEARAAKHRAELEETTKVVITALLDAVFQGSYRLRQVHGGSQNGKEWFEGCDGDIMSHFDKTLGAFDKKVIAREVGNVEQVIFSYIYL